MSTETPTRFEDASSDPTTTEAVEAVALTEDLEVPVPALVLDEDPGQDLGDGLGGEVEQPQGPGAPGSPAEDDGSEVPEAGAGEEERVPGAVTVPVGRHARATEDLAPTSVDSTAVRRRSIFADAETAGSEPEATAAPTATSAPEEEAPGTGAPAAEQEAGSAQALSPEAEPDDGDLTPVWKERRHRSAAPRTEDDIVLEGSTVVGKPAPRTAAHWAGVLVSLVLLPLAWFLLHDSAAQVLAAAEPHRFVLSVMGLVELAIGALALVLALWTARRSSLGSFLVGALALLAGLPGLAAPGLMVLHVTPVLDRLAQQSSLGEDLATYLWADAVTGRLVWAGMLLIMVGVVSHSARRAGRREQEVVDRVRKTLG